MRIPDIDLAWAAGAVDGEGCIAIRSYNHKGSALPQYRAEITVANTDPRMPRRMKEMFGGNIIRKKESFRRRALYEWRIYSTHAVEALAQFRPYLLIKGEQADIFLEFCKTLKRVGRHTDAVHDQRIRMKNEIAALKVIDFDRLEEEAS